MRIVDHLLSRLPSEKAAEWVQKGIDNTEYHADGHSVFVYGSLKRDFQNNDVLATQEFVARTRTLSARYRMVSMGYFPAVIEMGPYFIEGEVYRIDGETLWTLDIMEGQGDFYDRKQIQVADYSDPVWCYLLQELDPIYQNPNCPMIWMDADKNTQNWILPLDSSEFLEES